MKNPKLKIHPLFLAFNYFIFCILFFSGCSSCRKAAGQISDQEILGEDKNQDGIRDNIEKLIDEKYGTDQKLRDAVRQDAYTVQQTLLLKDLTNSRDLAKEISRAAECVFKVDPENAYEIGRWTEEITVDSAERVERYFNFNKSLSGKMLGSFDEPVCDFEKKIETPSINPAINPKK